RDAAASDAAEAAAAARSRRDDSGLADALTLTVMASPEPVKNSTLVNEAIQIWHETGCVVDELQARLVAARIQGVPERAAADRAENTLAEHGVSLETTAAGPLRALARSAPVVSIRTLGVFQVLRDGAPIPKTAWQSKKARDLLKILVARRGPVPRPQLMELLWPEADPGRAGNRLSVLLSAVRDVVQPGVQHPARGPVVTDDGAVWLDRSQVEVDVDEFLTAATLALEAHAKEQPDAIPQLEAAENRLVGDFLEDDPYQDWAAPLHEEVRAAHIALLRALISRLRDDGDVSRAVRYALRLLQRDGYDEQAHLDLVRIHLDAGHHGEARRHYQTYLARMEELGVEPRPFPQLAHRHRFAG
ncbi:MAG: transcriptional regulator, partial [Actinomycetota bacterium]|nr:transcriptional regulator [Actinomycetota bacterium]